MAQDIVTVPMRVEWVRGVFALSPYDEQGECIESLNDILTDLRHWVDANFETPDGIFDNAVHMSEVHWATESGHSTQTGAKL